MFNRHAGHKQLNEHIAPCIYTVDYIAFLNADDQMYKICSEFKPAYIYLIVVVLHLPSTHATVLYCLYICIRSHINACVNLCVSLLTATHSVAMHSLLSYKLS